MLTHGLFFGERVRDALEELRAAGYGGRAVLAEDLDVIEGPVGRGRSTDDE